MNSEPGRRVTQTGDVVWHQPTIKRSDRETQNSHRSGVLWFTGLSGSGKSTLAHAVEQRLHRLAVRTYVLDGDNVRHGLCADLGFSANDRGENIRRAGEVAKLFVDAGVIVLTAFISPFRADREQVRAAMSDDDFLEIYCRCPLNVCEYRDVKGLYKRARAGEIPQFTGISSPYEEPMDPALTVETTTAPDQCVEKIVALLHARGLLPGAVTQHKLRWSNAPMNMPAG